MDYKIMFIDIDGTLVTSEKKITDRLKKAISALEERGVITAIASGRPVKGTQRYVKELELEKKGGYVLAFNGAVISECREKKIVRDISLSPAMIREIHTAAKEYGVDMITYKEDTILAENTDNKYLEIEARINSLPVVKVSSIPDAVDSSPVKCLLLGDGEKLEKVEVLAKKRFEGRAAVFRSEPFFLEIMPLGIDKAASIESLISLLGIKREETLAFGDGFNDVSMISYAGLGVAMKNGCDEIKAAADAVTDYTNDEDGMARFIEDRLL